MKIRLQIIKNETLLCGNEYEIGDADGFGRACADSWRQLQGIQLNRETSIGALMEHIDNNVLDLLNGASITVTKV
jgi:hypothetical protein